MKQEFRLKADAYFTVASWEFCGVVASAIAFSDKTPHDFWTAQLMILLLFHAPSLLGAWCIARARIFVDEQGIYFREPFGTRFVAWGEIEDFGWEFPSEGNKSREWRATLWIGGKKKRLSEMIKNRDRLCEVIASRATNAPVHEWGLLGARACDPQKRTFVYRDTPNWHLAVTFFGMAGLLLLQFIVPLVTPGEKNNWRVFAANLSQTWDALEWWGRIGFVLTPLCLLTALPATALAMRCMGLKAKRRFLEQHIVVTREGLEQWSGPSRRLCAWGDIERFELERVPGSLQLPLCVLWVGRKRFDWHSGINEERLLRAIVEQRAINARTKQWQYPSGGDEEVFGGEKSFWPSGVVGVGPKRYHYRTRSYRALLFLDWLALGFLIFTSLYSLGQSSSTSNKDPFGVYFLLFFFAFVSVSSIAGLRAYLSSWLERDDEGLTHRSLFGRRSLRWNEITRVRWQEYFLKICGSQTTIRVGPLADYEHLLSDLEAHGLTIERLTRSQGQSGTSAVRRR